MKENMCVNQLKDVLDKHKEQISKLSKKQIDAIINELKESVAKN